METEKKIKIDGEEEEPWYREPLRFIMALFLLFIIVMWMFSYYAGKIDPNPKRIPAINEVFVQNFEVDLSKEGEVISRRDYKNLIKPSDPVIKQTADKIVSISCEGSQVCQAKAIFYFVRDNFQYVPDPNTLEYVKGARESLVTGTLDCEDGAILLSSLLEAIGIQTRFVFIPKHAYVDMWLPKAAKRYKQKDNWISLDVTCKNCDFGEIPSKSIDQVKSYLD